MLILISHFATPITSPIEPMASHRDYSAELSRFGLSTISSDIHGASSAHRMLQDAYIAATFGTYGETAYCAFLKTGLRDIPLMFSFVDCAGAYTVAQSALPHLPSNLRSAAGEQVIVVDYVVDEARGPVIPQDVWMPNSPRVYDQHVVRAVLRPPVFFVHTDGSVGLLLSEILSGNIEVSMPSQLVDVGRPSIHLHQKVNCMTYSMSGSL